MATLDEIAAKSTSELTAAERDKVREILEFDATPGTSIYDDVEAKIEALDAVRNQRLRAYIDDWDYISPAPVRLEGGTDAVEYSTSSHELLVQNRVRLLLGYEPIRRTGAGGIGRIPVGSSCDYHGRVVANGPWFVED